MKSLNKVGTAENSKSTFVVSVQIGRIERGEHNVTICSLLVIAEAMDVPLKELLDFKY